MVSCQRLALFDLAAALGFQDLKSSISWNFQTKPGGLSLNKRLIRGWHKFQTGSYAQSSKLAVCNLDNLDHLDASV